MAACITKVHAPLLMAKVFLIMMINNRSAGKEKNQKIIRELLYLINR